tara:strand:+ start:63 stop:392 length:330 start_codon:yes stop_codon:yes gene_type:complete
MARTKKLNKLRRRRSKIGKKARKRDRRTRNRSRRGSKRSTKMHCGRRPPDTSEIRRSELRNERIQDQRDFQRRVETILTRMDGAMNEILRKCGKTDKLDEMHADIKNIQ